MNRQELFNLNDQLRWELYHLKHELLRLENGNFPKGMIKQERKDVHSKIVCAKKKKKEVRDQLSKWPKNE